MFFFRFSFVRLPNKADNTEFHCSCFFLFMKIVIFQINRIGTPKKLKKKLKVIKFNAYRGFLSPKNDRIFFFTNLKCGRFFQNYAACFFYSKYVQKYLIQAYQKNVFNC